jgi:glycosyltransferase involved in cell wall biosynthesis
MPSVSIVIPVHDESGSLPALVQEVTDTCEQMGRSWEAIFVDDGSTDGSTQVLEELARRNPSLQVVRLRRNFGKSTALSVGFEHATGQRVVTLDADGQDDPAEIPRLLESLDQGFDLVSGWKRGRQDPLLKRLSSKLFNRTTALLSGIRLHDFNCGLKAYRGTAAKELRLYGEMHRYVPVLGAQRGWAVTEVPVRHRPRLHGHSKFGRERYFRGLFDLITVLFLGRYRHRPLHLFGGFGALLLGTGLAICLYLTVLKVFGGEGIGDRPLLLLGALLLVTGVQFLSLGLISELIAVAAHERRRGSEDLEVVEVSEPDQKERDRDRAAIG